MGKAAQYLRLSLTSTTGSSNSIRIYPTLRRMIGRRRHARAAHNEYVGVRLTELRSNEDRPSGPITCRPPAIAGSGRVPARDVPLDASAAMWVWICVRFDVSHRVSRCCEPRELCSWLQDCLPR
jgi:hypothetical protein